MERSARRQQICQFIDRFRNQNGYSPTIRDVCRGVGLKSTSRVLHYFRTMERDGLLKREQGVSRSVSVVAQTRDRKATRGDRMRVGKSLKGNAE